MNPEMRSCAKEGCTSKPFFPKSHNQIYCSKEHQKIETNRKIMEKYYDKKAQRNGEVRICPACNNSRLSMYNDGKVCRSCEVKANEARDQKALNDIGKVISK